MQIHNFADRALQHCVACFAEYLGVVHELLQELLVLQPGSPLSLLKPFWRIHTLQRVPAALHFAEQCKLYTCTSAKKTAHRAPAGCRSPSKQHVPLSPGMYISCRQAMHHRLYC